MIPSFDYGTVLMSFKSLRHWPARKLI